MKMKLLLPALFLITNLTIAQSANSPWPEFHHDSRHSGRSQYLGPQDSLIAWTFQTGGGISGEAAIGPDSTIYFGSGDGNLYALYPNGNLKWSRTFSSGISTTPAIGVDGNIYVSVDSVFCLSSTGSVIWKYHTGYTYFRPSSPVLMSDGAIAFVCGYIGRVIVLNLDGTLNWQGRSNGFNFPVALGSNDTIYAYGRGVPPCYGCSPSGGGLQKFAPSGDSIWVYNFGSGKVGPVLDEQDNSYLGTGFFSGIVWGGSYYVINRKGIQVWSRNGPTAPRGSGEKVSALADGWIYYIVSNGLQCINPLNGGVSWSFNLNPYSGGSKTEGGASPILDSDRNVYIGSSIGVLYCLDSTGTLKWNKYIGSRINTSGSISSFGALYIGANDGKLYAFGGSSIINLVSPIGGENWPEGSTQTILWADNVENEVKIEYSTNNGIDWIVIENSTPSDGSYEWTIPNTPSNDCRVRITDVTNTSVTDENDNLFSISPTTVIQNPNLFISSGSITAGASLLVNGTEFSPNASVQLRLFGPPGFEQLNIPLISNSSGEISYTFSSTQNDPAGFYSVYAVDELSNLITQTCYFEITLPVQAYDISISSPSQGDIYREGEFLIVQWADKMDPWSGYPINGAQRAYNYDIEISSDGGNTWIPFGSKSGYKPVGTVQVFEEISILSGVGSNFFIRVTDVYNPLRTATSGQFSLLPMISTNLQVESVWDYSFPVYRQGNPSGVSADGVARMYFKLSKINPGTGDQINGVHLALTDGVSSEQRFLGKVMIATVIDQYSDEANSASEIQITDNFPRDEYWFWYVSPDDFVRSEIIDGLNSNREVVATFTVTYEGGAQEVVEEKIKIVRPPLMLVHGLGGNADTWKNFAWVNDNNRFLFKDDNRFLVRKVITYESGSSLSLNSMRLLSSKDASSITRATLNMKQKGYASNQVYYLCHSMGGNLVRAAAQLYPTIFYKNYQKGCVDRIITLDSPHKGSPLADLIEDWLPSLNENRYVRSLLTLMYLNKPGFFGFNLIQPKDLTKWNYEFELTGAVNDLKSNNGFQHIQTDIPSHLVVGDLFPGEQIFPGVDPAIWEALEFAKKYVNFLDIFFDVVLSSSAISGELKSQLKPLKRLNQAEKVVKFIDYAFRSYVALGFVLESDLIVGVNSQLAGLPRNGPNQSIFDAHTHGAGLPYPVTHSDFVGNWVFQLINASIFSPVFAEIPSSTSRPILANPLPNSLVPSRELIIDSTGISLITPTYGTTVFVDSTLNIKFLIDDTTNLSYVKMSFQNNSIVDTSRNFMFDLSIQVNGSIIDSQSVTIAAFKEYPDSVVISTQSVTVFVSTNSPLINFSAEPLLQTLILNQTVHPEYRAEFSTFLSSIGNRSNNINAIIDDPSVIDFNPIQKSFKAITNGETFALVSYGGITDTIYFIVEGEETIPFQPVLYLPENQSQILQNNIDLIWNYNESATEYQVQVSSSTDFATTVIDQSGIVDTTYLISSLPKDSTYYWRVRAANYVGISNWSEIWNFTTVDSLSSTTFQLSVSVLDGWNMVSIPGLHPTNQDVDTWWPNLTGSVFKFSGSYVAVATAATGEGYWMKHTGDTTYNTGDEWPAGGIEIVPHDPISAATGWNMIGGYEDSVATTGLTTTPPGLISGSVFGYSGSSGYVSATNLVPGYGYWIKLTGDGFINILPAPLSKGSIEVAEYFKENWGKITITDNAGRSYTLYAVKGEVDLNLYELPPMPPAGMFDIRFGSGRIAEDINNSTKLIEMTGIEHPIKVKVENMEIRLQDELGKEIITELEPGEEITISNAQINKLMVSTELIPDKYVLYQNYPNPFNPSTIIKFALPQDSKVDLTVFNILGEKVVQLADQEMKAGYHQIEFNASTLASGVYLYRIKAGDFIDVKKMILLK